jgi:hypothetical protein
MQMGIRMSLNKKIFSSGLKNLDKILNGVAAGDNIVWQIDTLNDYIAFVHPFCRYAYKNSKKLIYFRFAEHMELLPDDVKAETFILNPKHGFEHFITEIFKKIEEYGKGVCYVFDSLSFLSDAWNSDQMVANFFMLTCPYLYDFETATYFALTRNYHTRSTIASIHNTAQIILDVYHNNQKIYVLPIKVYERYSPTMYMLHSWEGDSFKPIMKSTLTSEILSNITQPWLDINLNRKDAWINLFIEAQTMLKKDHHVDEKSFKSKNHINREKDLKDKIIRMNITRDEKLVALCNTYFDIAGLIEIGKRIIGSGFIGGKSVGMLLARAILKKTDKKWQHLLETHDSFFVGSDVFYTYIIQNKCWWERHQIKFSSPPFETSEQIEKRLLMGNLPHYNYQQLKEMLKYFGQFPIIVRSSSLLEDAYGNAFSGKYESVFCANQNTPVYRLKNLIDAIRIVYASTMNKEALYYRYHWGLFDKDEQMALLIQRVSGSFYNHLYLPQVAGVGYSFNPFVWNRKISPEKGVARLVFGLGTRAVDQNDDYARIVALNAPHLRPEAKFDDFRKYAQKSVDLLDIKSNNFKSLEFDNVVRIADNEALNVFISNDHRTEESGRDISQSRIFKKLSFHELIQNTPFIADMQEMLAILEKAYAHPVDIEFTVNFIDPQHYRINLLQCRPFKVTQEIHQVKTPLNIDPKDIIIKSKGPIIGQPTIQNIDRIIYIRPLHYSKMSMSDRYMVARLIGDITNQDADTNLLLIGPGRWGSSIPALGIPVSFSEIKNASVLCEIAEMHEGLVPDISFGTHFFNDLIEMRILYLATFRQKDHYYLNEQLLLKIPNKLNKLLPGADRWTEAIKVIDQTDFFPDSRIAISVNVVSQEAMIYLD